MTRISFLLDFGCLIFIGVSLCDHMLLHDSPSVRLNHDRRISLMRLMAEKLSRALIVIRWTKVHEIYVRSSMRFDPMHLGLPRRLQKKHIIPHREN